MSMPDDVYSRDVFISTFLSLSTQGWIQGGAYPARAPSPKIGKNLIFLHINRDFSHKIPQNFSGLPPLATIFF